MRRLLAAWGAGPEGPHTACPALPSLPGCRWQAGAPPAPCQPGTASSHSTASALGTHGHSTLPGWGHRELE